jgi:hypothetical protein
MKMRGILILFPLVVSLFLPLVFHISVAPTGEVEYLVSLDVCNAVGSFISHNDNDDSAVHECLCRPEPFECAKYIEPNNLSFTPSLYFVQLERPPKS